MIGMVNDSGAHEAFIVDPINDLHGRQEMRLLLADNFNRQVN